MFLWLCSYGRPRNITDRIGITDDHPACLPATRKERCYYIIRPLDIYSLSRETYLSIYDDSVE
jgi:hypothetical protein